MYHVTASARPVLIGIMAVLLVQMCPTAMSAASPVPMPGSSEAKQQMALEAGVRAVIYGLPLVLFDITMRQATNVIRPRGFAAPVNQFANVRQFPTAAFKNVVRANVDTLYSSAFLDLSGEPVLLTFPPTNGRYYLLPILDAWTDVLASPGTRTTGSQPGTFAITGPDWNGTLPSGVQQVKSPTNLVWILGRTQTNGPDDYAAVHAIQDGYKLLPLSAFGKPYTEPEGTVDPAVDMRTPPIEQIRAMSAATFFDTLARLLKTNPPPPSEAPILAELAKIGVIPGERFDAAKLDPDVAKGLANSVSVALDKLQEAAHDSGTPVNGWHIPPAQLGNFGTNYALRAVIALIAFGANLPADAVYPTAFVDGGGKPLDGANRYILHFDKGATPPVRAFWSLTMYDSQSFFVANPIDRYAISSWMHLRTNTDGSIDIFIQHDSPGKDKEANWLPAPGGPFNITLRMYWPKETPPSILDGSWKPPAITRV